MTDCYPLIPTKQRMKNRIKEGRQEWNERLKVLPVHGSPKVVRRSHFFEYGISQLQEEVADDSGTEGAYSGVGGAFGGLGGWVGGGDGRLWNVFCAVKNPPTTKPTLQCLLPAQPILPHPPQQ